MTGPSTSPTRNGVNFLVGVGLATIAAVPLIYGGALLRQVAWNVTYPDGGFDADLSAVLGIGLVTLAISLPFFWTATLAISSPRRGAWRFPGELLAVAVLTVAFGALTLLHFRAIDHEVSEPGLLGYLLPVTTTVLLQLLVIEANMVGAGRIPLGVGESRSRLTRLGIGVAGMLMLALTAVLIFAAGHAFSELIEGTDVADSDRAVFGAGVILLLLVLTGALSSWMILRRLSSRDPIWLEADA